MTVPKSVWSPGDFTPAFPAGDTFGWIAEPDQGSAEPRIPTDPFAEAPRRDRCAAALPELSRRMDADRLTSLSRRDPTSGNIVPAPRTDWI